MWSPDSTMLAYNVTPAANDATEIWVMNADGSSEQLFADADFDFGVCDWDIIND